jgi:hypothetical protein
VCLFLRIGIYLEEGFAGALENKGEKRKMQMLKIAKAFS